MLPAKRKREGDSSNSSSVFLFLRLPNELQADIIELACRLPSTVEDSYPTVTKWLNAERPPHTLFDLDTATTLDLTITCRAIHPLVARVLYSHIRVTRPSALKRLYRALASRPQLGRFIKSLHIGPSSRQRDRSWWPLEEVWDDPSSLLSASNETVEDELRMPEWCESAQWPVNSLRSPPDCREASVIEAIKAAQRFIDVDLENSPCTLTGQHIDRVSRSTWTIRLFEVQAALDLYLAAMRRYEEASTDYHGSWRAIVPGLPHHHDVPPACREGTCGHYPPLRITGCSSRSHDAAAESEGGQLPVTVSQEQILVHLARPGALTDQFDHVLLFLRSGANYMDLETHGRAGSNGYSDETPRIPIRLESEVGQLDTAAPSHDVDSALTSMAMIPTLISLARSILTFSSNVANLSLTGFLVKAVCGTQQPPPMPRLTSLALGPMPAHWCSALRLEHPPLVRAKDLWLAGMTLLEEEVRTIARDYLQLEKLTWVMGCRTSSRHPVSLVDIFNGLLQTNVVFGDNNSDHPAVALHPQIGRNEDSTFDVARRPLIEAQLHPDDVAAVLAQARSTKVREALQRGDALPRETPRRLLLIEGSAAVGWRSGTNLSGNGIDAGWNQLYKEGWQWWLDQAKL